MKRLAILALLIASSAVAQDQIHPNLEQGVAPNKLYQFGNLDTVNLFNGNLMIHLPIGASYPVGPGFAYQLMLSYNSKLWDYDRYPVTDPLSGEIRTYTYAYPDRRSNAGLGWTLSLGELLLSDGTPAAGEKSVYEDGTGNQHRFWPHFHGEVPAQQYDCNISGTACNSNSPDGLKRVLYSGDGSNLRLKVFFNHTYELDFPNGDVQNFDNDGRLVAAVDAFGNSFSVTYVVTGGLVDSWTLQDSHFRSQTVTYRSWMNAYENYQRVPAKVELKAFSEPNTPEATATYTFEYIDVSVARGCGNDPEPGSLPEFHQPATVPVLKGLTLPDGSSYSFTYQTDSTACAQGAIVSLQFPTGGTRKYEYQNYGIPATTCESYLFGTPRIESKSDFNVGATSGAKWTYAVSATAPGVQVDALCPDPNRQFQKEFLSEELQVSVISPEGHQSVHYFSIWPTDLAENPDGFDFRNYGYPMTSFSSKKNGTRFLSSEEYQKECPTASTCTQVLKRRSYVLYDGLALGSNGPPRVIGSRTVFHDDGDKYVDTDSTDYDGYGHLRTTVTSSTFETNPSRTVTTRYNPLSTANGRTATADGLLIGRNSPWILDTYDRATTEQGTDVSVVDACFDATGFLSGRRTYKNTGTTITPSANDVVTTYSKRTTGPNFGFVADEHWFGGDLHRLPDNYSDLCSVPASTQDYGMEYTYASGVLKTSKYSGMNWLAADRDIDSHTGLVSKSRDSSGVETALTYDTSGRLKTVTPAGRAWTEYTYNIATDVTSRTTFTPASFVAKQCPLGATTCASPLTESRSYFDDFGRVVQSKSKMPDNWSTVNNTYDSLGRAIATSMPQYTTSSDYEPAFAPDHWTTTTYDAFDRPLKLTAADGKETTFAYTGTSKIDRTTTVATSSSAEAPSTTTDAYDGLGRLYKVTEPVTSGNAANSITTYAYDIGGRLSGVSMVAGTATESRSFTYDGRGFLQSETHPELGLNGKSSVTYESYDARGHAGRKLVGTTQSDFDLAYQYDSAERLFKLDQLLSRQIGDTRPLKQFNYVNDVTASTTNRNNGKLETAIRYDYPVSIPNQAFAPPPGQFVVTDTLSYANAAGLVSSHDTKAEHKNASTTTLMQQFTQSYTYNDLAQLLLLTYPTCVSPVTCTIGSPLTSATSTYSNGVLSAISGYAMSLKYHPSGMLSELVHGQNGVVDVKDSYTAESGMPRPASITFTGWDDSCAAPSAVVNAANQTCGSSAANQASVTPVTGATYLWEITNGNGSITSGNASASMTYTAGPSGTVALRVTVSTSCGSTVGTKNVAVTAPPTAGITSGDQTINPNGSATIQVALTGTSPWRITWSDNFVQNNVTSTTIPPTSSRTVSPTATTTYSITAVSDAVCTAGTPTGNPATITIGTAPPTPTGLTATTVTNSTKQVIVSWNVVSSATSYQLERAPRRSGPWTTINLSCNDSGGRRTCTDLFTGSIPVPVAYVYQVKAVSNSLPSNPSMMDYATVADVLFTDDPLQGGVTATATPIRGRHVGELRAAIDAVRKAADPLNVKWFDYSPLTGPVLALQFYDPSHANDLANATDLRNVLDEAVLLIRGARLSYSPPAPATGVGIFAYQLQEIREGVK
jgi:YD repeat-containing protein